MVFRPQQADSITPAALTRVVAKYAPTLLIDELDTQRSTEGAQTLQNVLNSGFRHVGKSVMCVGDDHDIGIFSTYSAKAITSIGPLWSTVESRSIPILLQRASNVERRRLTVFRYDRVEARALPIKRQLQRSANDSREPLRGADPVVPDELGARQGDIWRPLLAIADLAGGEWPFRSRAAAISLHSIAPLESDYGLLLLQDLHSLFERAPTSDRIASTAVVAALSEMEDRPRGEYKHQKPITPIGVAKLLARFDIKPKTVRLSDGTTKGYLLADCAAAFATYLPAATPLEAVTPEHMAVAPAHSGLTPESRVTSASVVTARTVTKGEAENEEITQGLL